MRMYAKIKFDREITKEHYIIPGGYAVKAKGKEYSFDFLDYEGYIDENDKSILHCYLKNIDDSYSDTEELKKHLHDIAEISEFFVYTGEDNEPEIRPIQLLELVIDNCEDCVNISSDILERTIF